MPVCLIESGERLVLEQKDYASLSDRVWCRTGVRTKKFMPVCLIESGVELVLEQKDYASLSDRVWCRTGVRPDRLCQFV